MYHFPQRPPRTASWILIPARFPDHPAAMQSPTFTWYPLVPLAAHFAPFADRIACRCQPRTALKALEAADRIPFCPPRITESGHYATTASPTPRQIYFLSSLPAKPSQLSALPRRSDSILQRFPRKRRPIFSLQLRFLTVLLLPDPAPPFQSWFSHSFPSASADMYLWSCYDADQIMDLIRQLPLRTVLKALESAAD